jgi:hypothetical protein
MAHLLHAVAQLGEAVRVRLEMMGQLLAMQQVCQDHGQSPLEREAAHASAETLFHPARPSLQDWSDGLAVAILEGHGNQVDRPIRAGLPRLDDGLHADGNCPALERLHEIVQVVGSRCGAVV